MPSTKTSLQPTTLAAAVEEQIERYQPTSLATARWEHLADDLRALVRSGEPVSVSDARQCLGALSGFIAWADANLGEQELRAALTATNLGRYDRAMRDEKSPGTRDAKRVRLNRSLRVLAGDPARTKRGRRPATPGPYTADELEKLAQAATSSPALKAALTANAVRAALPSGSVLAALRSGSPSVDHGSAPPTPCA